MKSLKKLNSLHVFAFQEISEKSIENIVSDFAIYRERDKHSRPKYKLLPYYL